MLIPFAKLKDTALLVSNILRDFDPDTMFWRIDSPILFPNYDKDGFTPCKDVRKPFSVQIILESFSRSCGYKSYNALLADQHRLEILDVHLNDLNPAPRNAYYTAYWNNFINTMLQSIHTGIVNKTIPSYLTYRNFKFDEHARKRMAFMGLSLNAICDVSGAKKFDFDFIPHYYPIALSVLMTALQFPRHKMEGIVPETPFPIRPEFPVNLTEYIKRGVDYCLIIPDLPLSYFLVHKKWHEPDFKLFKTNLMITMHEVFGMSLNIVEHTDDPLDSVVNVVMPYDFYEVYNHGSKMLAWHEKLKGYILDKANAVAHDKSYYTHSHYKAITATRSDFTPKEFTWNIQQGFKKAKNKNIDRQEIYGTKAFWLNQCYHLFAPRPDGMLYWNDATREESVDSMLNELRSFKKLAATKRQYEYQFEIQGISEFIRNTGNIFNVKDIPRYVTVYSDDQVLPGFPSVAKMAVHAKIVQLLKDAYDSFDIHNKLFGNQNVIEFQSFDPELENPKLKLKQISDRLLNKQKSDLTFNLNYTDLIYSMAFNRVPEEDVARRQLKPYPMEIQSYEDKIDFAQYQGSYEDLIFTQGINYQGYYCMLNLELFELPYNTDVRYDIHDGWQQCQLHCILSSLDPDKVEILDLRIPFTEKNAKEPYRCPGYFDFTPLLTKKPEFLQLIKDYLRWSKPEWKQFKALMRETENHQPTLNDIQNYITCFPNGMIYN